MWHVRNAPFILCVVISIFNPLAFPSSIPPPTETNINPLIPYAMMPKKVLDLSRFPGLPKFLVFTDDNGYNQPYSSWDSVNNSQRLVETNTYRRYDVVCSSHHVRNRFLDAIDRMGCVKARYVLDTASCVVHVLDVIEPARFSECCHVAPLATDDYILVIHEVAGAYQIISGKGVEVFGYLTEALTYVRR